LGRNEAEVAALEVQPLVIREVVLCRIAEAWLEGQRKDWTLTQKPSKIHGDRNECP
jgi:hypothetical protein